MKPEAKIDAIFIDLASDGFDCPAIGELLILAGARALLCHDCHGDIAARVRAVLARVADERAELTARQSETGSTARVFRHRS